MREVFGVPVAVERATFLIKRNAVLFESLTLTQCNLIEIGRAENRTALFGIY